MLCCNFLVPLITLPTRITDRSSTLIDNIFSNHLDVRNTISGNFTISISDHLPQFLLIPKGKYDQPSRVDVYQRPKNFDVGAFLTDFENLHWKNLFHTSVDTNAICETFFSECNEIIDKHLPVKKLSKKEAQIFKLLCVYKNKVLSREMALKMIWGENDYFKGRSMDVFII